MSEKIDRPYSYDLVPYPNLPFAQTHPDALATVAILFGMNPQPINACRVLEIGCGGGGNLVPLAEQFPESRYVGIDLSAVQIAEARSFADRLGLTNIELRHGNLLDVEADLGEFDYIICHGVYSWVPDQVQAKILEICASNLAPQGVAYVSYNTYPGWHVREMIRHMMCYHAKKFSEPKEQIGQARALLDFLSGAVSGESGVYGRVLESELKLLRRLPDAYLFHEHLEEANYPIYFHQFVERARARGLQYLGEVHVSAMYTGNLPKDVAETLKGVAQDLVQMEQYMDFVCNRSFRQSLLCRQGVQVDRRLKVDSLAELHVASPLRPIEREAAVDSAKPMRFQHPNDERNITTANPLLEVAMVQLAKTWPESVPFRRLVREARSQLRVGVLESSAQITDGTRSLGNSLLRCYAGGLVEFHQGPSRFCGAITDRPVASAVARLQSESGNVVTSRRHESVRLNDFSRRILRYLDGTRTRAKLLNDLLKLVEENGLTMDKDGQPMRSRETAKDYLAGALDENLPTLASAALLVG